MRFISYIQDDTFYEFIGENGLKLVAPVNSIILIDDNSGLLSIKLVSTRKTIGTVYKNNN